MKNTELTAFGRSIMWLYRGSWVLYYGKGSFFLTKLNRREQTLALGLGNHDISVE